jgi:GNAT superfamily N-acetyltransferase
MCEIRQATLDDIPALAELLSALFAQEAEFKPQTALQEEGLRLIITDPAVGRILVASKGGTAVGMVNLLYTVSTALGARVAILEDMVVRPDARGAGIGALLVRAAIAHARADGCRRITLLTDADNESAHRFYRRHGFAGSPMIPFRLMLSE